MSRCVARLFGMLVVVSSCFWLGCISVVPAQARSIGHAKPLSSGPKSPSAGQCTQMFRAWRRGVDQDDTRLSSCLDLMGINKYCANHDSFVAIAYIPQTEQRYFACAPYSHPDSVGDQFEHLSIGISEGVEDAFIASVPFMGPAIEAAACLNGVLYACAVLALDITDKAGLPIAGVAGDVIEIAAQVPKCVDGDIAACARIGARGASRAAGFYIPGRNPDDLAADAQRCDDGDFAACSRLGRAAADAAGVPPGLGPSNVADGPDCLNGSADACTALGQEASKPGVPLGGLSHAGELAPSCTNGDLAACQQLGEIMVGKKVGLDDMVRNGGGVRISPDIAKAKAKATQRIHP